MRRNLKRLLALAMVLALILSGLCDSRFQVLAQESTEAETEVLEEQDSAEEEQKEDEASEVVEEPEIADVVEEPEIADVVEEPEIAEELEATGETADSGQAAEPDVAEASEGAEESEEAALNEAAQASSSEEVKTDAKTDEQADTQASSPMRIVRPGDAVVHTYTFYDEDGTKELDQQILSVGETLNEPETPEKEHARFVGWYTDVTEGELFDAFGEEGELTESIDTVLYARYETVFYVYYMDEKHEKVIFTQTYHEDGEKVVVADVPFVTSDTEAALIGWSTDLKEDPDTFAGTKDLAIEGDDLTLYPVVAKAHWITFKSDGGSVTEPVFVRTGETTTKPEDPVRAGYAFAGWYEDEACTKAFSFGGELSANVTLYAKWDAVRVNYTVLYWQENADDDGYSLKESEVRQGLSGTLTEASASKSYKGFSASTRKLVVQQTIAGDGSTVVHVYYDRNIYTVKFMRNGRAIEELTITAKYGANISNQWPSRRKDLDNTYPSNWRISRNGDKYQSGIATMPIPGDTANPNVFYYVDQNGNYTIETRFYLEGLDGNYVLDHTDSFRSRRRDWTTTDNDYYPIKGFTVRMSGDPSSPRIGSGVTTFDWRENIHGWNFYYSRNSYAIHFYDGENELTSKIFKYQADISGADFTPQPPTGREDYVFQGWYDNESLEGTAYSFEGKTMPAGDFPLYAKWTEPVYEVSFDLNGADLAEQAAPDAYDDQQVKKGEIVTRPADPVREGYTFAGWTRADSPFHFGTGITADTTLKARWISNSRFKLTYDPGAGVGDPVTDSRLYADGAKASLLECPKGWQAPQEHYGFLYWNTRADGSGRSYYPSDSFTMPADDVTLYAQWALIRETSLTYVYNYEGAPDPIAVPIETPNALYAIEKNDPERTGYRFIGWTIDQAGNGTLYQKGDKIRVDTLDEETNKLYAQWEIEIKPPTGLATETMPFVWMLVLAGMTVVLELTERKKDR